MPLLPVHIEFATRAGPWRDQLGSNGSFLSSGEGRYCRVYYQTGLVLGRKTIPLSYSGGFQRIINALFGREEEQRLPIEGLKPELGTGGAPRSGPWSLMVVRAEDTGCWPEF